MKEWQRTIIYVLTIGMGVFSYLCISHCLENKMTKIICSCVGTNMKTQSDAEKRIALTFDDGPHPCYTEQLLDGLKERDVKVTFFVTGEHADMYPELICRMKEEGHLIGNHTYTHIQLTKKNRVEFKKQLLETNRVIQELTGEEVQFVRPPYGSWDKAFEKELNMIPVLWNVDPLDWRCCDAKIVKDRILEKVKENDIILLHDSYASTVTATLEIIDLLKEKGYRFVTVDELILD